MRFLIKATIPVETGNALIRSGKIGQTIQAILADLKPEAAYFTEEGGQRTVYVVTDIAEPSQIPAVAEPWWLAFNADVEFHAAMTAEDLGKAMSGLEQLVKKY
jgi:hypothetical protein